MGFFLYLLATGLTFNLLYFMERKYLKWFQEYDIFKSRDTGKTDHFFYFLAMIFSLFWWVTIPLGIVLLPSIYIHKRFKYEGDK